MRATVDAAIVGAGIIGASIAERILARRPSWRVVLLEREEAPGTGETRWATGGVRQQFGTEANVRLSQISLPIFELFEDHYDVDPGFRQHGYLFVTAEDERLRTMDAQLATQQRLGVATERLDRAEMKKRCPPLFTDDLAGGNFNPKDGSIQPAALLQAYVDWFRRRGGALATEAPVTALERGPSSWTLVTPRAEYETEHVVLACGPQTRAVARLAGLDVPANPFARQVFVAEAHAAIPPEIPLTVDLDTGWYVHAQRSELLLGGTDKQNRPLAGVAVAEVDWSGVDAIFSAAAHRMPVLADAKIVRAYAGARTLTPDHHPILGPVASHPGLYLAAGLSGHGIMHSPAVGILLAEWVTEGAPRTWDARPLTLERFASHNALDETAAF
ncbi:MAG: FAD-binding oxidoreductase [Candidatus Eremiobacteraeota bacterium]|nr:FAD-binding oxidoreductase [Candidatus Eremiobacteraeota bacterium]